MNAVVYLPPPAGAPAAARYFKCERLVAELSTTSCATQWKAAATKTGTACHSCPVGQCHAQTQGGAASTTARRDKPRICLRCGRDDLRVVQDSGICISCYNREAEWRRGRNAKGFPPANFPPLLPFSVATEAKDGAITYRHVEARQLAEAVGVVAHARLRRLPEGTCLSEQRPGPSAWSADEARFVVKCPSCGHAGLLERTQGNTLHYHCPICQGPATGPGWALAGACAPTMLLDAGGLVAWLDASKEKLPSDRWTFTTFGCRHCGGAMLQARGASRGHVAVRCPACGEQAP
jgi:phage FluMu protein Com